MTVQALPAQTFRWNRTSDHQFQTRYCLICQSAVSYAIVDSVSAVLIAGEYILAHSWCTGAARSAAEADRQAEALARVEEAITGEPVMPWPLWCVDCNAPVCCR